MEFLCALEQQPHLYHYLLRFLDQVEQERHRRQVGRRGLQRNEYLVAELGEVSAKFLGVGTEFLVFVVAAVLQVLGRMHHDVRKLVADVGITLGILGINRRKMIVHMFARRLVDTQQAIEQLQQRIVYQVECSAQTYGRGRIDATEAYRLAAQRCDYPLHLGVTEAGTERMGLIKSGMGIGGLLLEGIGDTLRVSLTDEPENEVLAGYDILRAVGYAVAGPEIISCPTCGRTQYPMMEIAREVEERLRADGFKKPLKIAIMGCIVNGPGEASDADIGIAGGKDEALLFIRGQRVRMLKDHIVDQLIDEIYKL